MNARRKRIKTGEESLPYISISGVTAPNIFIRLTHPQTKGKKVNELCSCGADLVALPWGNGTSVVTCNNWQCVNYRRPIRYIKTWGRY